ncbi:MAG: peptidylprolyl isomerase [Bacteroidetes bacterium]|nr:peptidylprolyl isomerase [Bacteroidota bacterium]
MYLPQRQILILWIAFLWLGSLPHTGIAQQTPRYRGDRILAVVDESVILESDVEAQMDYLRKSGEKDKGNLKCEVFESLLMNKLLLAKAKLDSVEVKKEQVEEEVRRRLDMMERQLGSREELERIAGKSYLQFKMELGPQVEEQLLVQTQRNKIFNEATITPKDVKDYFRSIPKDSIPYLPAELEISQLVIKPTPSQKNKDIAREKLENIRNLMLSKGESFNTMARIYSQDGSAQNGGLLPRFCHGDMVPEFEEVAYSLAEGEISAVFESPFGFHVILLEKRIGQCLEARHILITPVIDSDDEARAKQRCADIRKEIMTSDTLTFSKAAMNYSEDRATQNAGGRLRGRSGEYKIPMEQLDSDLFLRVDRLKENEISDPLEYFDPSAGRLTKSYRLVVVTKRHPPHLANLEEDYQKFYQAALNARQNEILKAWLLKARKQIYFDLRFDECRQALSHWNP